MERIPNKERPSGLIEIPIVKPEIYWAHSPNDMLTSREEVIQIGQNRFYESLEQAPRLLAALQNVTDIPDKLYARLERVANQMNNEYRYYPYKIKAHVILSGIRHFPPDDPSPDTQKITITDHLGDQLEVKLKENVGLRIELSIDKAIRLPSVQFSTVTNYGENLSARGLREQSWSSEIVLLNEYNLLHTRDDYWLLKVFNEAIKDPKPLTVGDYFRRLVPIPIPS